MSAQRGVSDEQRASPAIARESSHGQMKDARHSAVKFASSSPNIMSWTPPCGPSETKVRQHRKSVPEYVASAVSGSAISSCRAVGLATKAAASVTAVHGRSISQISLRDERRPRLCSISRSASAASAAVVSRDERPSRGSHLPCQTA
jgi:hypothetical protein